MNIPGWVNVSRETLDQLARYAELLEKWTRKINLVAPGTLEHLWDRHIWDSYQLLDEMPDMEAMADLGSGGGLPGLIVAIARPQMAVTLVERDQRKAAFLTQAALSLGLTKVRVVNSDITAVAERFPLVTARALASLDVLCELSHPRLLKDAFCLFPKGENFASEIEDARKRWDFTHRVVPSKTHDAACIISISKLSVRG